MESMGRAVTLVRSHRAVGQAHDHVAEDDGAEILGQRTRIEMPRRVARLLRLTRPPRAGGPIAIPAAEDDRSDGAGAKQSRSPLAVPPPRAPPGAASAFDVGEARAAIARARGRRRWRRDSRPVSRPFSGRATLSWVTSRRGQMGRARGGSASGGTRRLRKPRAAPGRSRFRLGAPHPRAPAGAASTVDVGEARRPNRRTEICFLESTK